LAKFTKMFDDMGLGCIVELIRDSSLLWRLSITIC
jgi:hypothetical protein